MQSLVIGRDDAGQRVDRFVRKLLPSATLGHVFKLLRTGRVRVNGRRVAPDTRLEPGDEVELRLAAGAVAGLSERRSGRRSAPPARSRAALRVLHRDEHVLAVDKPAMLLVQSGERPEEPTLDELVRDLVGPTDAHTFRPGLAHRLDRGTSGIVLFGLSGPGLRGLTEAFRGRRVTKRYLALVSGTPPGDAFEIDLPLARDPSDESRGKRVKVSRGADAQEAVTDVHVLARSADSAWTLVEARPLTGRTHQIRAHLRAAGLPIAGDPTYGVPVRDRALREAWGLWRQFLHAWRVELEHPVFAGRRVALESPLPDDLVRALERAGVAWDGRGPAEEP